MPPKAPEPVEKLMPPPLPVPDPEPAAKDTAPPAPLPVVVPDWNVRPPVLEVVPAIAFWVWKVMLPEEPVVEFGAGPLMIAVLTAPSPSCRVLELLVQVSCVLQVNAGVELANTTSVEAHDSRLAKSVALAAVVIPEVVLPFKMPATGPK